MIAIQQIKTDGTVIDLKRKRIDFRELQELVSTGLGVGVFEFVGMKTRLDGTPQLSKYEVGGQVMAVHEEGLLLSLPINAKAMAILGYFSVYPIVGDVVIIENEAEDFE